ncbi:FAD-dependent oxidoreductase [Parasutterella muris]|jgi:Succinate dehydrogenase/fumarate reductase, flavoprotein subunit|uniref:FAD-dependent oxidoreductase n=2 Tax=Parasutterella TaxID=577310 RepID=A0A6L6YGR2_9BURK|nr:FAD-dependent oxidoreductase [Parasutterella muris]MVX56895.1 FAD-dependent oxidoreductase [Parasutterella muris]
MQTSRRSILKGSLLATMATGFASASLTANAAEKTAAPQKTYDLVICGLGIGGIVTAIRAAQDGLKPVILEKMGSAAGNTVYSAGFMLGVNTKMQQAKGLQTGDTVEKFYEDMMKVSQGRGDPALTRLVAEKADETLNWLHDYVGVQYNVGAKLVWPMLQRAHLTTGEQKPGGKQLMTYLLNKAKELNIPIVYNAKVVALLDNPKNGDVIGARVKTRKGFEEYLGKLGVVMATGGFSANKMMLTMMSGVPAANMPVRGSNTVTGESILLTGPYFPKVVNVDQYHCGPIHGPTGANPLNIVNTGIAVSKQTQRYTDEGKTYVQMARDTAALTKDNWGYMIVDEDTHNLPMLKNDWFSYESKKAPVYKADTIEGLAKEAGLDPVELKKIVDEYNAALQNGKLGELTPPNTHKNPRPILKAPFYAVPFQGGMTATFGGPLINTKGQVLDTEGRPIKGLYAVGNAAGGLFYDNYVGGAQLTSASVIGMAIADHMKALMQ